MHSCRSPQQQGFLSCAARACGILVSGSVRLSHLINPGFEKEKRSKTFTSNQYAVARAEKKNGPLRWPPLSPALLLLLLLLFSLSAKPGRFLWIRSWNKTAFSPTPASLSPWKFVVPLHCWAWQGRGGHAGHTEAVKGYLAPNLARNPSILWASWVHYCVGYIYMEPFCGPQGQLMEQWQNAMWS